MAAPKTPNDKPQFSLRALLLVIMLYAVTLKLAIDYPHELDFNDRSHLGFGVMSAGQEWISVYYAKIHVYSIHIPVDKCQILIRNDGRQCYTIKYRGSILQPSFCRARQGTILVPNQEELEYVEKTLRDLGANLPPNTGAAISGS